MRIGLSCTGPIAGRNLLEYKLEFFMFLRPAHVTCEGGSGLSSQSKNSLMKNTYDL